MAVSKPILKDAGLAGVDLSNSLNLLVKRDQTGAVVLCGVGDVPLGSIYEGAVQGHGVTVDCKGIIKVKLGGVVSPGEHLACGASGVAVLAGTGAASIGTAREGGTSGSVIAMITP